MQLTARPLIAVSGVNSFDYSTQVTGSTGDAMDFYVQLVDLERHPRDTGANPPGLRYIPVAGATLKADFSNLNDANKLSRFASQPFTGDGSIWKLVLLSTDPLRGTVNIKFTLTESGVVRTFNVQAILLLSSANDLC